MNKNDVSLMALHTHTHTHTHTDNVLNSMGGGLSCKQ